jgi:hypothetical protein
MFDTQKLEDDYITRAAASRWYDILVEPYRLTVFHFWVYAEAMAGIGR